MATAYDPSLRDTRIARDVTVLTCVPAPSSGASGTPVDVLGLFESVDINLKREFADTTGAADLGTTSRAHRWGKGSVKLTGFSRGTYSRLAAIFMATSHTIFQFQESATGELYQLMCSCEDFNKAIGKDATKDTITLGVEGVPYYAPANGTLAPIPLEA